jgi:hypothetical protein
MLYPKERIVRSEAYLRAVASLPCWRCGICGFSQACHGDAGKGMAMKACDLTAWPGCGPRQNEPGCHYLIGSTGRLTREMRRSIEKQAAEETQALLKKMAEHDRKLRATLEKVGLL